MEASMTKPKTLKIVELIDGRIPAFEWPFENPNWLIDKIDKRIAELDKKKQVIKKYRKQRRKENLPEQSKKEWTVRDTMRIYPDLTEEEAKKAWEMGW